MSLRTAIRSVRTHALAAGALAVCLAVVPGTAWAEEDPATPAAPEAITDVLGGEQASAQEPGQAQSAEENPEPPAFEIPPEVVAAFQQLAAQAGVSEECVTGVAESLELIGNGVAGLPAELQQLVTDLGAAVQESIESQSPTPLEEFLSGLAPSAPEEGAEEQPLPIGGDIAAGLQQLADTLQSEACRPAPPAEEPPTQGPTAPVAHHEPPKQSHAPAPQPPAQPVVYPGYAPTGAEKPADGPSTAAIAIVLGSLAGGTLVWTARRGRAADH